MTTHAHRGPHGMEDLYKTIAGFGAAAAAAIFGYHKFTVDRSKTNTVVAQEDANTAQFANLQAAIKSQREEMIELRAAFHLMDRKIHVQQRTITRMEMLLRQFSGLVQEHGIAVPAYMQGELIALIDADQDRTTP